MVIRSDAFRTGVIADETGRYRAENLPGVLRTFAEWNPVSSVTQAARELFGNIPPETPEPSVWPLQNAVLYTIIWIIVIIAIFAPLSVNRYRKAR